MKPFCFYIVCLILAAPGCSSSKRAVIPASAPAAQSAIDSIHKLFAPDKRTALFDITVNDVILSGETNIPEAKTALLQILKNKHINYIDSIRTLPDTALGANTFAVVSISVANLRLKPGHPNEMVTQATLGTPLKVLKKEKGWYLVQTPDKYMAWTEAGGIKLMGAAAAAQWQTAEKVIYTNPFGFAYVAESKDTQTLSDLVYGDVLTLQNTGHDFYETRFPDGRVAYISRDEMILYKDWAGSRMPTAENLIKASKKLMGVPYLWGGTSFKGVDCSGFTRTVYFMNGLILPRDASQQVNIGKEIDTKNGWQNLQAGDLLFFGTPAKDGKPEKVVHVGMWVGGINDEFIQSAGRVQISSFNPDALNFDGFELHRFLRAKHVTSRDALYDLRNVSFY